MVLSYIADITDAMVKRDSRSSSAAAYSSTDSVDAWVSVSMSVSVYHFTGSRRAA